MKWIKKIRIKFRLFRSLPHSLLFNLLNLPFHQAIKIPILLYRTEVISNDGSISIESKQIKFGMIRMGFRNNVLYPATKFVWENRGKVIFQGSCSLGSDSGISIAKSGELIFGDNFKSGPCLKLACYGRISFGKNASIAWEVIIMDTSFHKIKSINDNESFASIEPIRIGSNNWITSRCTILKGTVTPDYAIIATGTVLHKNYSNFPSYSLLGGSPVKVKKIGIWRDVFDD